MPVVSSMLTVSTQSNTSPRGRESSSSPVRWRISPSISAMPLGVNLGATVRRWPERIGQGLDMLDRLVTDHGPVRAEGAVIDIVQGPGFAHFAEDRMPRILGIDIAAADIPFVRMMQLVFGVFREMLFQRLMGTGRCAALGAFDCSGCHVSLLSRGGDSLRSASLFPAILP